MQSIYQHRQTGQMEGARMRWRNEQVVGTDPMYRVIDTGMEFAPPPNIDLEAERPKLERLTEIVSDVDPAAFRSVLQQVLTSEAPAREE